jgi:hypothetical protein
MRTIRVFGCASKRITGNLNSTRFDCRIAVAQHSALLPSPSLYPCSARSASRDGSASLLPSRDAIFPCAPESSRRQSCKRNWKRRCRRKFIALTRLAAPPTDQPSSPAEQASNKPATPRLSATKLHRETSTGRLRRRRRGAAASGG